MSNNVLAPTGFTTLSVADTGLVSGTSKDSVTPWPQVGGLPAAGCAAFQSISGGVIFPSMTQAQINALPLSGQALMVGSIVWNLTTQSLNVYTGASWSSTVDVMASGTLTAAQINGMSAAPLLLVAAPTAGYAAVVSSLSLNYVFGSAAFTGGGNIVAQYGNTALAAGTAASATIPAAALQQTHNTYSKVGMATMTNVASTVINSGVNTTSGLYLTNATAPFAVGTGCTVNYVLNYKIVSVV